MTDHDVAGTTPPRTPHHAGWDSYWDRDPRGARRLYAVIASIYRRLFICPRLAWWLARTFPQGSTLLHAGCGSGEVDALINRRFRITGLDISPRALERYRKNNPHAAATLHADLMQMSCTGELYDGIYSLGVLEHFTPADIRHILHEMKKVLRPGGRMVAFWPLAGAISVKVLGLCHRALNRSGRPAVELHPPEITLLRSRTHAEELLHSAGWKLVSYSVSPCDLLIQAVVVCEPLPEASDGMA
jgi:SAM-dependent methyltransferase